MDKEEEEHFSMERKTKKASICIQRMQFPKFDMNDIGKEKITKEGRLFNVEESAKTIYSVRKR